MTNDANDDARVQPEAPTPRKPRRRVLWWAAGLGAGLLAILVLLGLGLAALNTRPGRDFLTDRIAAYEAASGLKVRVGAIEGSIYGRMTLRDVEVRDPAGAFVKVPAVTLDWRPLALLGKKVDVRELTAATVQVLRKPAFRPTPKTPDKPLLPDIDIAAGRVQIDRIILEQPVTGKRHVASVAGSADLADGRARLNLRAGAVEGPGLAGGDQLRVMLDVVPEANRMLVDVNLTAPADGLLAGYLDLDAPLAVSAGGRGDWASWTGRIQAQLGAEALANVAVTATDGLFGFKGPLRPAALIEGAPSRLLEPAVELDASGRLRRQRLEGRLGLRSPAVTTSLTGAVDLNANRLHDLRVTARLLEPGLLAKNLTGRDIALEATLDGRMARPIIDYDLSAAMIGFGETRVEGLRAEGRSRVEAERILVPVKATAARVTGLGAAGGGLLTNLRLDGDLAIGGGRVLSDNLRLRSDRIDATAVVVADLGAGLYTAALKGRVNDYAVDGLGRFNLVTDARLKAGADGAFGVEGSVRVSSQRIDNAALGDLLGGQGVLSANVALQPGGAVTVADLRLDAPKFKILGGGGAYRPGGALDFRANAVSEQYGPLALIASGTAERPTVRLTAASPNVGVPLTDVVVDIAGTGQGYRAEIRGGSPYGPFAGQAMINTEPRLSIDLSRFSIAGVNLAGQVSQSAAGPFAGALQVSGSGLSGAVRLGPAGTLQRLDVDLQARQAQLPLKPTVTIASGRITGSVVLAENGPQVSGDLVVADLRREAVTVSAGRARVSYRDGAGDVGLVVRGRSGAPFDIAAQARLTPDLVRANLQGTFNRVAVRLAAPAEARKTADGWRLAPARLVLPDGELIVSGETGAVTEINARLRNVDLGLVQSFNPEIALEGSVSGLITARLPGGAQTPTGSVRLDIDGFSRVGLATESPPVGIALRGDLSAAGLQMQALARRGGATIGRVQARAAPGPGAGSWTSRLMAAPLSGGVRYAGPADVLWALTGVSGQEISGPITIAADFSGRVEQPTLAGVVRADALRYENAAYSTVISNIALRGQFTQSRLEVTSMTGRAGDGRITAKGWLGLDAAAGFPMDFRATFDGAQLANSDDIDARVSGTLAVTNNRADGALIQADLRIPEARYRVVRQGSADVPVLAGVRRQGSAAPTSNRDGAPSPEATGGLPSNFRLDVRIRADNRIFVSGMGLEAEAAADLRVGGDASNPIVTGRLELVRGTFSFAGRRLDISQAEIRFDGGQATNPLLDIAASAQVEGVTTTINVGGRAQNPQITFSSTPALPQDEVLSRLLFGSSISQLSPTQAIQVAAALNSLRSGGGGLDPLGRLRSVAGVDRLRIVGGDAASGRGTGLAAGAYLGRNAYVEVITDTRGFAATQLEIALSRTLSLLLRTSSFAGSGVEVQYSRDY